MTKLLKVLFLVEIDLEKPSRAFIICCSCFNKKSLSLIYELLPSNFLFFILFTALKLARAK